MCSLWIAENERQRYAKLISLIEEHTEMGDPILALPVNPELYYLSGRRNPCRFYNVLLDLQTDVDLERTAAVLEDDIPRLIFFRREDKYVSPLSLELLQRVQSNYRLVETVEGFEVYVLASRTQ